MTSQSSSNEKESDFKIGNYQIKKTLGEGTFGKVKLGIYLPTKEKMAIKILEKKKIKDKDDKIRINREFEMLSKFNHINVILVTEIFESPDRYYCVMEYCEGGELFNYIVKKRRLSEEESAFFYYQIINGLEYIHSLNMVHRDLKPENLLITKEHILKIIDFGLSNYYSKDKLLNTPCGSPCYASPEMISGKEYDGFKIDIWSSGIILYAMLCGYLPFEDNDNDELFKKILECKIDFPNYLSNDSIDLIKKILVIEPNERISILEIKTHPFFILGKNIFDKNFTIKEINHEKEENEIEYIQIDINDKNINNTLKNNENEKEKIIENEDLKIEKNKKEKMLIKENEKKQKKKEEEKNNKKIFHVIENLHSKNKGNMRVIEGIKTLNFQKRKNSIPKTTYDISEKISKTEPNTILKKKNKIKEKKNKISTSNHRKKLFSSQQRKKSIIKPIINSSTISQTSNLSNICNFSNNNTTRIPFSSSFNKNNNKISSKKKPNNITIKNTVYNFNMIVIPSYHKKSFTKLNSQSPNNSTKLFHMLNRSDRRKLELKTKDLLNDNYIDTIIKTQENYINKTVRKIGVEYLNNINGKNELSLYNSKKKSKIKSMKLGEYYKNYIKNSKNCININTINNKNLNSFATHHSKIYSYQTTSTNTNKNLIKTNNNNSSKSNSKSKSKQSIKKKINNICIKNILRKMKK